jgi:hypothetical protein
LALSGGFLNLSSNLEADCAALKTPIEASIVAAASQTETIRILFISHPAPQKWMGERAETAPQMKQFTA